MTPLLAKLGSVVIALPGMSFSPDYPPSKWDPKAMTARRTLPTALASVTDDPAVYRFEFGIPTTNWYVGETGDFRDRLKAYAEMTRLLLALRLYPGPVCIQKHAFRAVQVCLADAMLSHPQVTLSWR